MNKFFFLFAALGLSLSACQDAGLKADIAEIEKYLDNNNLVAESLDSGLHYIITEEGTGMEHPTAASDVNVIYKGYLLDGTVFDQTPANEMSSFNLGNVIEGWRQGIPLLKAGGKGTLFIPSDLGYGDFQVGPIPAGSVLVFDVELLSFSN
ncbi:MAG: FKBP-type peptidyl-prolyl cis-trans isomerase [Phaeodactylibacter sp.]|nr:FKBP-type peptidyl-prolyl cis-trans isomerase [Phaeodactylibacter sp.]